MTNWSFLIIFVTNQSYFQKIMPKKTFSNLADTKKQALLDMCFEEFAINNYDKASITRVVKKLGIAKGSIYQYFENKKDLYFYLIDYGTELRLQNVKELFQSSSITFKDLLIENFLEKVRFDNKYPTVGAFLFTVMKERFADDLGNMEVKTKERIVGLTRKLLQKYVVAEHIRKDIQIDIMAYTVVQVQMGLYDFLEMNYNIDFRKNIKEKKPMIPLQENQIKKIIEQFAEILLCGIKNNSNDKC